MSFVGGIAQIGAKFGQFGSWTFAAWEEAVLWMSWPFHQIASWVRGPQCLLLQREDEKQNVRQRENMSDHFNDVKFGEQTCLTEISANQTKKCNLPPPAVWSFLANGTKHVFEAEWKGTCTKTEQNSQLRQCWGQVYGNAWLKVASICNEIACNKHHRFHSQMALQINRRKQFCSAQYR